MVASQALKYVDRTARGTAAGKNVCVCCASASVARDDKKAKKKRVTVEKKDEDGQHNVCGANETRIGIYSIRRKPRRKWAQGEEVRMHLAWNKRRTKAKVNGRRERDGTGACGGACLQDISGW